jgi:phage baseplate assembly protein W
MSYVVIPPSNVSNINTLNTSLGIDINFSVPGVFVSLNSIDLQASAKFKNLLLTMPGERYENPLFGCNLREAVFEPNTTFTKEQIINTINAAVSNFTPYINIETFDIITVEDNPAFVHYIQITIQFTVNRSDFIQSITVTGTESGQIFVV